MMTKTFKGASVFMSRNLVPPEIFDSLHDALKHNGAEVLLCCDPSRNGPNDYHIISSIDHEKFNDLRSKGCNLLGPQCVLSCAQENRPLPKQGFTCCLAMDGVKILASGFDMDEKVEIGKLVTAMGGVLHTKASIDISFVIVKNVLAAKYKWALNILKKPIVTLNWLSQCWKEHRVVPQESYKVLPFSGLTICVTRIRADERKEMEKLVVQNGGKYSAELTKTCTHLICDVPEGDKYKVAKRWGNIHIITRKWFDQSIARRACLNEESYPVLGRSVSSINTGRTCSAAQHSQDKGIGNFLSTTSSMLADSNLQGVSCAGSADPDLEATLSQNMSFTFSDTPVLVKEQSGEQSMQPNNAVRSDVCVADDSQIDDNDLYLSECRILLVGFDATEMRKLVNMVRRGGGSRYMSFNDKLTHIVVGTPSEDEKKNVRALAAMGVIYVVKAIWLDDCDREKKEMAVLRKHIAYDLVLPKDTTCTNKGVSTGMTVLKQVKFSAIGSLWPDDQFRGNLYTGSSVDKNKGPESMTGDVSPRVTVRSARESLAGTANSKDNSQQLRHGASIEIQDRKSSSVFGGRVFRFSNSFPEDRRAEIVQWISEGGGKVVEDHNEKNVHFTIECHGLVPGVAKSTKSTVISSHWIRSCLEDGCMLDAGSHILYTPLPCQIPLPAFKSFRFCVSQYNEKDRLLLRNLCFVLGAKFVEKLTKKVTHLLCKFASGPKYEAACKWGIRSVTSEWIYECVKQNDVVAVGPFCPKEATTQDQEAGFCTTSQYPTQAARMLSADNASQFQSQSQDPSNVQCNDTGGRINISRQEGNHSSIFRKKVRLSEDDNQKGLSSSMANQVDPVWRTDPSENAAETTEEFSKADVASAIEDLLEQTSKIHDLQSPRRTGSEKSIFPPDSPILVRDPDPPFGLSKLWMNRTDKREDICNRSEDVNASLYDGFSETQTDSQVVGYEEDLSGRQMIIDRVRTRSSLT